MVKPTRDTCIPAGTALRITEAHKLLHHDKVVILGVVLTFYIIIINIIIIIIMIVINFLLHYWSIYYITGRLLNYRSIYCITLDVVMFLDAIMDVYVTLTPAK